MADSDPISDSTPNKRRKLNNAKAWDSQDDSGDDLTADDFNTVATLPLTSTQKNEPHNDNHTYITQPTQTLNLDTQPLRFDESLPNTSDVLVEQSSPIPVLSPPRPAPPPVRRAFTSSRPGLLASAMAPAGTNFRAPLGVQPKPKAVEIDDSDEDPPVQQHSSDDEDTKRGPTSTLKYTNFKKGGRGMDSEESVVKESPRPAGGAAGLNVFSNLLSEFRYGNSAAPRPAVADDMASAYGTASRRPRLQQGSKPANPAAPKINTIAYKTIDDISDSELRSKVKEIQKTLSGKSVQLCMDALTQCHGNVADATCWLITADVKDASSDVEIDELASTSPVAKRGVAIAKPPQPMRRATAKQEIKAPTLTIGQKWAPSQANRRVSQPTDVEDQLSPASPEDEKVQPQKRRLQQGRKVRSPSPPSSPAVQKPSVQPIIIDDDSDSDAPAAEEEGNHEPTESGSDQRLLKFFNECSVPDLVDLSAQPSAVIETVLQQRPFRSLDTIRAITIRSETKSGKKSKAQPIGDKIVDACSGMWLSYDAVDVLVGHCESIAKPIQQALKKWGVGTACEEGELQLMNLNEAHDSGIGTPSSSCHGGDGDEVSSTRPKLKGNFIPQPESMSAELVLKDYQLVGLNWLNLLWSKKVSCILADDMGLGKTCQVIAFLAHLQQQNEAESVHLIIVPGSTLENWLREFERFAPKLRVVAYYGSQSEREEQRYNIVEDMDSIDAVVTTYDVAKGQMDNKFLRKLKPAACVFDEAHGLKNTESKRYRQLVKIPADFRILLTGTPVQNNLKELVSILAFIMPDLFEDKRDDLQYIFQHKASTKDADHGLLLSTQRIARARTMMTPFILRRKKNQVLDLPAKHSRVEYCEMTASQATHYQDLLQEAQDIYSGTRTERKASANILMSLRKAAIHALLSRNIYDDAKIDKMATELQKHGEFSGSSHQKVKDYLSGDHHQSDRGGDYGLHVFCQEREYLRKYVLRKKQLSGSSGKVDKFRELIRDFVAKGDRILVFSQFTSMMNILESVLNEMDVRFMRLDGSTKIDVRQTMLDTFTDDESIPVFMLSTKAGGAGINLACANKVIIFDSGFNPQDDVQAENRAHRVGQTREVEVVRLVTRGTIEEQIYALGELKLALDARVAGGEAAGGSATGEEEEKKGREMVERMFRESLEGKTEEGAGDGDGDGDGVGKARTRNEIEKGDEKRDENEDENGMDLRDAFKSGLESKGVKIVSKQAQF